jgi:hypothetical protein
MADDEKGRSIETIISETVESQIFWTGMVAHMASFALDLRFSVCDIQDVIYKTDSSEKMMDLLIAGKLAQLTFIVEDRRSNRQLFLAPMKYIFLFEEGKLIRREKLGTFLEGGPVDIAMYILRDYLGVRDFSPSGQFYVEYAPLLNLSRLLGNLWLNFIDKEDPGTSVPLRLEFNSFVITRAWLEHIGIYQDLQFGLTRGLEENNPFFFPMELKTLLESLLGKR